MKLETGICGEQSVRVSAENTAKTMGSGTLDVFATPALVALADLKFEVLQKVGEAVGNIQTYQL